MTLMEVCVLIQMLDERYGHKTGLDTARLYAFLMRDVKFQDAKAAVERWIRSGKTRYMTVADIREEAGYNMSDDEIENYTKEHVLDDSVYKLWQ